MIYFWSFFKKYLFIFLRALGAIVPWCHRGVIVHYIFMYSNIYIVIFIYHSLWSTLFWANRRVAPVGFILMLWWIYIDFMISFYDEFMLVLCLFSNGTPRIWHCQRLLTPRIRASLSLSLSLSINIYNLLSPMGNYIYNCRMCSSSAARNRDDPSVSPSRYAQGIKCCQWSAVNHYKINIKSM